MRYTLLNPKVPQAEAARFVGCTPMAVTRKLQELRAAPAVIAAFETDARAEGGAVIAARCAKHAREWTEKNGAANPVAPAGAEPFAAAADADAPTAAAAPAAAEPSPAAPSANQTPPKPPPPSPSTLKAQIEDGACRHGDGRPHGARHVLHQPRRRRDVVVPAGAAPRVTFCA